MDESLEGTWVGTENPVKAEDNNNNEPVFTKDGTISGETASGYRATRLEGTWTGLELRIGEVHTALDVAGTAGNQDAEDDSAS